MKCFGKGRNRLELQNFVEASKLVASATGRALALLGLNSLLLSKLPCGQKGTQQIAESGSTQRSLPGRVPGSWFLLSLEFVSVPCAALAAFIFTDSQPHFWCCLPQLQVTLWVTACSVVTAKFTWPYPSVAIIEVWLRLDDGPMATRLLLEQAGTSSGPGKPCHVLSSGLTAQSDACHHFLAVEESHPLTNHLQSLKNEKQVMTPGYKCGLEFSLHSELFGYRVLWCVSQDTTTIANCLHLFALL